MLSPTLWQVEIFPERTLITLGLSLEIKISESLSSLSFTGRALSVLQYPFFSTLERNGYNFSDSL